MRDELALHQIWTPCHGATFGKNEISLDVGCCGWRWSRTGAASPPHVARETFFNNAVRVIAQDARETQSHAPIQRLSYATLIVGLPSCWKSS